MGIIVYLIFLAVVTRESFSSSCNQKSQILEQIFYGTICLIYLHNTNRYPILRTLRNLFLSSALKRIDLMSQHPLDLILTKPLSEDLEENEKQSSFFALARLICNLGYFQ